GDCDAASTRGRNGRRGGARHQVAAPYRARRLLGNPQKEARTQCCLCQRGAGPGLPHRRAGERMKPATRAALARQHSGGPSPVPAPCAFVSVTASIEAEIAGLLDRSTQELRLAWRQLHRTGPPLGLSRDLLIRALAYDLQQRAHGGPTLALGRRLQRLAATSAKGALAV